MGLEPTLQAGESLAYIRGQLGHHSIKVTVDIYGHLAPEENKAAVDRLDDNVFLTENEITAVCIAENKKRQSQSALPLCSVVRTTV